MGKKEKDLVLRGTQGIVINERFVLKFGQSAVVGRSRSCDFSLKKCETYLKGDKRKLRDDKVFVGVSRKHFRISYLNKEMIEIEDLSVNGTTLDGNKIKKAVISDLEQKKHEILMGKRERFTLEFVEDEGGKPEEKKDAKDEPKEKRGKTPEKKTLRIYKEGKQKKRRPRKRKKKKKKKKKRKKKGAFKGFEKD